MSLNKNYVKVIERICIGRQFQADGSLRRSKMKCSNGWSLVRRSHLGLQIKDVADIVYEMMTNQHSYFKTSGFNPLECRGNYSATSNNMKLVNWPLMGGLLHLVQRGGDWAGLQPAQAPSRCTKCSSPPINGQCTNHRIAV